MHVRNVKGGTSQIYAPLIATSISGSGCIGVSSVTKGNNVIVYAQSATTMCDSKDEGDAQRDAETTWEVSEEEFKPSPRKPRIKLGEIMGILNKRVIEATEK
eukprot:Gb_25622 [translate_table: standard]